MMNWLILPTGVSEVGLQVGYTCAVSIVKPCSFFQFNDDGGVETPEAYQTYAEDNYEASEANGAALPG